VLNAAVNPAAQATTWYIQWGTTTRYGHNTARLTLPGDNRALAVRAAIGSLTHATTYHFRIVATNASGTTYGRDRYFRTAT
jgi:hypothetical protein